MFKINMQLKNSKLQTSYSHKSKSDRKQANNTI